jgi:hypothetical protein
MSEHPHHEPTDAWRKLVNEYSQRLEATHPELSHEQIADVAQAMADLQVPGRAERTD